MPVMVNGIEIKVTTTEEGSAAAAAEIAKITTATNQVDSANKTTSESTKGLNSDVVSLNAAWEVAERVVGAVGAAYSEVVGVTLDYSNEVRTLRDITGQSTEEASRLLQFLDDYKISAEAASVASKRLTKEGLELNIQTIANLSEEYLQLNTGQERAAFLMDKFGKQGERFSEVMLLGRDAILAQNDAIDKNLILTDESLSQAREYEKNIDNLNDSWMALKVTVGNQVIPVFNQWFENQDDYNRRLQETIELHGNYGDRANNMRVLMLEERDRLREIDSARWDGLASLYATNTAMQDAASVTEDLTEVQSDYYESVLDGAESLFNVQSDYIEKQDELKGKQQEILDEINMLLEQGWSPYSEKIQELQDKYDEFGVKIDEAAEKHRQRMGEMQYDLLMTRLSADGLTDAEYEIGLAAGVAFGVFDQEAADASKYQLELTKAVADGKLSVQEYGDAIAEAMRDGKITAQELLDIIDSIPSRKTFTFEVIQTGSLAGTGAIGGGGLRYSEGTDGWQTVPPGYPNDSYPLWVESGERYAVIPASGSSKIDSPIPSGSFGGGGGSAQIVFAPTIQNYFGNENDMMRQLYPAFVQMLDQAKADGHLPATF